MIATSTTGEGAARRLFFAVLWLSALVAFGAHVSEAGLVATTAAAAGILIALALWLHVVHRIQGWPHQGLGGRPLVVMLAGAYVALALSLALDPAYLFLLFGIYTLTFGFSASPTPALWLSAIVTVVWLIGWLSHGLPSGAIATPVFVWVVLNGINHAASRVAAQNEERRLLLEEIDRTRAQLAAAERQQGVLEERQRVAAEIHDTLAQGFTSIVLLSEATATRLGSLEPTAVERSLDLIERTARDNLAAARRLVDALRPPELDERSLVEAIERLAERHQEETDVPVEVRASGPNRPIGGTAEVTLLRAAQEALANSRKHADAGRVGIEVTIGDDAASITVEDDGAGFELGARPSEVAGGVGGRGLDGLRRRVEAVGGVVEVRSQPGEGTMVSAQVPVTNDEDDTVTTERASR